VQSFECGDEPYEVDVRRWITEWIWQKPWRDRTVIATDTASGLLVGYGTWAYVEAFGTEPVDKHIEIAWFGVDSHFKGVHDSTGHKAADLLYATVEQAARADGDSTADLPLTLTCDVDNIRGRAFWERQGYVLVGPPYAEVEKSRYHRMVR
jgi:hypothetical protein